MEKRFIKTPSLLLNLGFQDISEYSTDCVRTHLFEKVVNRNITFRVRFTQYISDGYDASYVENNEYDFEEITMSTSPEFDESFLRLRVDSIRDLTAVIRLLS